MNEEWIDGLELTCATYPHIHKKMCGLKFAIQKVNYITHMLNDTRDGTRHGFDADCYTEMINFMMKHTEIKPASHKFTFN